MGSVSVKGLDFTLECESDWQSNYIEDEKVSCDWRDCYWNVTEGMKLNKAILSMKNAVTDFCLIVDIG